MKTRKLDKSRILRHCFAWPPEARGKNECVTVPNGGGELKVGVDGAIALAVFSDHLHPFDLLGVYDLNPELFGLDLNSPAWREFIRLRDRYEEETEKSENDATAWDATVKKMIACLPDEIPYFSRRVPLRYEAAERNGH